MGTKIWCGRAAIEQQGAKNGDQAERLVFTGHIDSVAVNFRHEKARIGEPVRALSSKKKITYDGDVSLSFSLLS